MDAFSHVTNGQVSVSAATGLGHKLVSLNVSSVSTPVCMQVKVQTTPGWAKGLTDGMPKFIAENGVGG